MANASFGVNIIPKNNTVTIGNSDSPWTIVSPSLTGVPTAPTAETGTNTTQVATTAFVQNAIPDVSGFYTKPSGGIPNSDLATPPVNMTGATASVAGTAGYVPAPIAGDDEKYLRGDGLWSTLPSITSLYRQFWSSADEIEIQLSTTSSKTFIIWCAGSTSGTSGDIMDANHGAYLIVSNGKYAVMHKGTSITVTESSGVLTISSDVNIAMAIIEL